jgi:hypothetical protein
MKEETQHSLETASDETAHFNFSKKNCRPFQVKGKAIPL